MRILYFMPRYWPSIGGAQLLSRELIHHVATRHEVVVATQFTADRDGFAFSVATTVPGEYQDGDIRVHRIGPAGLWRPVLRWLSRAYDRFRPARPLFAVLQNWAIYPQLSRLVHQFRPDILHAVHMGLVYSSETAYKVAHGARIPIVWTPFPHIEGDGWRSPRFRRLYRSVDAVVAMTQHEKRWLIEQGASEQHVHVLPLGPLVQRECDPARFRQTYGLKDAQMVLFLGQKLTYKGYRQMVEAAPIVWKQFPDARFVFVGPRTEESERFFAGVTEPRIIELPAVSDFDKASALAACDVFCMPSTQESLGGVYLEAWTFSKPVIAARLGATAEVIADGQDGLLVQPDAPAVADAINTLLRDPVKRERMGASGHRKVQKRYAWQRLAEQTIDLYQNLLQADR